jgi:hypothetical protein
VVVVEAAAPALGVLAEAALAAAVQAEAGSFFKIS